MFSKLIIKLLVVKYDLSVKYLIIMIQVNLNVLGSNGWQSLSEKHGVNEMF